MEDSPGIWKVLDFGVSKLVDSDGTLTQDGAVIGTPAYMAPEQATLGKVGPQGDVYALGAILFRVLTGRRLFGGTHSTHLLFQVAYTMPPSPKELCPGLSLDMERVLALSLAKSPADRLDSADEIARAVRRASKGKLSKELRERGDELLARYPWGSQLDSDILPMADLEDDLATVDIRSASEESVTIASSP